MPTIVRFRLRLQDAARLRLSNMPAQGWLLELVHRHSPDWAQMLHPQVSTDASGSGEETARRASYTVGPLFEPTDAPLVGSGGVGERAIAGSDGSLTLRAGTVVCIRVGFADDDRALALLNNLPGDPPPLRGVQCRWERQPVLSGPGEPDALVCPWEYLVQAPPAPRLRVSFVTPTAFKRRGALLPLFEPERLWAGWRDLWQNETGGVPPFADELLESGELPRVSAYQLETRPMSLKGGLFIGAVGFVEWTWKRDTPAERRQAVAALAAVADFLGTGAKTALGMGQTRCHFLD